MSETKDDDDGMRRDRPLMFLGGFAVGNWVAFFVLALISSLGANGIFGIPFATVVDVLLSAQLTLLALIVLFFVGMVIYMVKPPTVWSGAAAMLFLAFVYLLMPYAALAAYWLYAYFGHLPLSGQSFVYDGVLNEGKAITTGIVNFASSHIPSVNWKWLQSPQVQIWGPTIVSAIVTLLSSRFGRHNVMAQAVAERRGRDDSSQTR